MFDLVIVWAIVGLLGYCLVVVSSSLLFVPGFLEADHAVADGEGGGAVSDDDHGAVGDAMLLQAGKVRKYNKNEEIK